MGSGKGVKVAVIDTGIAKHPDLKLRFETNCVSGEDSTEVSVTDGHGTHVAGIIAGKRHGIAPDVELYSFKVFPRDGPGENLYIARAIDQAVDAGCDLINLSLSSNRPDELLSEAIGHAFEHGCVCVVAAGNATRRPVGYPAWFKRSLAVSAIGKVGTFPADAVEALDITGDRSASDPEVFFAGFSNHGREIDLCAPGVGIASTWLGGGYAVESGTSMACPVVTGVGAALISADKMLLSKKPADRTLARSIEIVRRIQGCCETVGFEEQSYEGFGWPRLR
jgi:subtilisin